MKKLVAIALLACCAIESRAGQIYWTEADGVGGMIRRANGDGSGVETVIRGLSAPVGIAIDETERKVYWTEVLAGEIWRADLDGGSRERIVSGLVTPIDVVVDPVRDQVFWTDMSLQEIGASSRSGGGRHSAVADIFAPESLAIDAQAGVLYWTNLSDPGVSSGSLGRFELATGARESIIAGLSAPWGIAVDPARDLVYWSQVGDASLRVSTADGSGQGVLLGPHPHTELPPLVANGLALDYEHRILFLENGLANNEFGLFSLSLDSMQPARIIETGNVGDITYTALVVPEPRAPWLVAAGVLTVFALRLASG